MASKILFPAQRVPPALRCLPPSSSTARMALIFLGKLPDTRLLAQANRFRCDLDQFVFFDEFEGALQPHFSVGNQSHGVVGRRSAHVGEFLFLCNVDTEIY